MPHRRIPNFVDWLMRYTQSVDGRYSSVRFHWGNKWKCGTKSPVSILTTRRGRQNLCRYLNKKEFQYTHALGYTTSCRRLTDITTLLSFRREIFALASSEGSQPSPILGNRSSPALGAIWQLLDKCYCWMVSVED